MMVVVLGSTLLHVLLLVQFGFIYRAPRGTSSAAPASYDFAILAEEQLTSMDDLLLEDTEPVDALDDLLEEMDEPVVAPVDAPTAQWQPGAESLSSPQTGGGLQDDGLGGGSAGTSFFGISSRGRRFAFIVDRSGSMSEQQNIVSKMYIAKRELIRSIESLPDYASFHIVFFSSELLQPPMQQGWSRARPTLVRRYTRWLDTVDAQGGTIPRPAFLQVFALSDRPDVIYFLTDGEIPDFTAEDIAELNRHGRPVVINTIAFGNPASQDLLKEIAEQSGGIYRFVSTEGY